MRMGGVSYKALRSRNWEPLPMRARDIDAV